MNIALWLHSTAQLTPHNPALLAGEVVIADYAEFARRASAIGRSLKTQFGIEVGDRIGLFMNNRVEYLEALYGIWWSGAVAAPINAKLHLKEAAWILRDADARLVITDDELGSVLMSPDSSLHSGIKILSVDTGQYSALYQIDGAPTTITEPVARESYDLAWLFYTSGTTGKPKGVMLSHANLIAMSLCYPTDVDNVSSEDAALYAAPMSHGAGLYNFIHVRVGARHVVPPSGGFESDEVLDLARRLKNVAMFAAPTMVQRLLTAAKARGENGEGIKTIVYAGGPMYLADIEAALEQMGPRFIQIYGQGECPNTITVLARKWHSDKQHPKYRHRLSSVGRSHSISQVRITGEDGVPASTGNVGEIEVKGPAVMLGYWKQPEASADTIRDGWLRTGDMGFLDEEGFLTLRDRSKDVIISGGSNIYPREVEEALLMHPDVQEACVVGKPDPEWGEIVVAFIVTKAGQQLDHAAFDQHCLSTIARFKRPKEYIQCDALPKNNTGKVLRRELREKLENLETGFDHHIV
ncbi:AMP-binding protein [bacterium]|nr:AMP-binding protein [bacterium]